MKHQVVEKYEPLRALAPSLWVVDGEWQETAFRRRMTVVALKNGDLVLHSPVAMKDVDLKSLEKLGRVAYILAPNIFHTSETPFYAERYPSARVFAPEKAREKLSKLCPVHGSFEKDWPAELKAELPVLPMQGTRFHESVFLHAASRTLILTDLVFNMPADAFKEGFEKKAMGWNQVVGRFGPSRAMRWILTSDKGALTESLRSAFAWDFDRVVMNHGRVLDAGGKSAMREGFLGWIDIS